MVQQSRSDGSPGDLPTDTFCLGSLSSWLMVCCLHRYVVRRHWKKWNLNQDTVTRKQQLCRYGAPKQNPAEKSPSRERADRAMCKRETERESHVACTPFYVSNAGLSCNHLIQCWRSMFIDTWRSSDTGKHRQGTKQFTSAISLIPNHFTG